MNWTLSIVLGLLVLYIVSESGVLSIVTEGFTVPPRADIGYSRDGWGEEDGYVRDQRYTEAFVDIMGHGAPADFCRAVAKEGDPDSLCIACALGTRDGMDTLEYRSLSKRDGFRFSRDDYWRSSGKRQDYCRIVKDDVTGNWYSTCAIAGREGFKKVEERDTNPPPAIQSLLRAYEGIMVWWRWRDDNSDFAQTAAYHAHGRPVLPETLNQYKTRGLELNRDMKKPLADYLRWGETGTLTLDQTINPRQVRAIMFWVYWDGLEKGATIVDCSNDGKDRLWLGIEGGGHVLAPASPLATPAQELSPQSVLAIGQLTEPAPRSVTQAPQSPKPLSDNARYVFEIWDTEQRLMRLESPMGTVKPGEWQHVLVTTTDAEAWWPTWEMWINGERVAVRTDGRLSPAMSLAQNFIGRHVRGCITDFRMYRIPVGPERLKEAIAFTEPYLHPSP